MLCTISHHPASRAHACMRLVLAFVLAVGLMGTFFSPAAAEAAEVDLADGSYRIAVTMEGGSGRASIESPTELTVEGGTATARITWSSPHYDYMLVEGTQYLPVNTDGNSVFEIPVATFDEPFEVIGDTTAMSMPHEITYQLTFDASSIEPLAPDHSRALLVAVCVAGALAAAVVIVRRRLSAA